MCLHSVHGVLVHLPQPLVLLAEHDPLLDEVPAVVVVVGGGGGVDVE